MALPAHRHAEARNARRQDAADLVRVGRAWFLFIACTVLVLVRLNTSTAGTTRDAAEPEAAVEPQIHGVEVVVTVLAQRIDVHVDLAGAIGAVRRQHRLREREALPAKIVGRNVDLPGQLHAAVQLDQPFRVLEDVADAAAGRFGA